ncbi:MAG: PEGA domain-containing protein [Paludibacteraceae bacterium]|nr:PEGA domain-containing protein [Paludibacteraceae bacterium]
MIKRLMPALLLLMISVIADAKIVKVSVTPSDAKIYLDGNYAGDGVVNATVRSKEGFVNIKLEKEGYVTLETKIYASDKRKAVSYVMRQDPLESLTVVSGKTNKYFTINVSKSLYTVDENGKIDSEQAWKMIHQIILNYFDEIQTTDIASGFIQTPWKYTSMPEAEKMMRTRVNIREISSNGNLTFQVKVSSELASLIGANNNDSYQEVNRIHKEIEPIIGELQSRLTK